MKEERERKEGEGKGGKKRGEKGRTRMEGRRKQGRKNGRVRERRIESPRHFNEGRLPCIWHLSAVRNPQVNFLRYHLQQQKSNTWCEL